MKTASLAIIALCVGLLIGCAGAPTIPADLCSEQDQSKSVLLRVAAIKKVPLNQVYYGLIDITAIGLATKKLDQKKIAEYMGDVKDWYLKHYPVSYTDLIDYMTNQESAMQLAGILSRRIGDFKSYLFVSKYDDCMLRAGWNEAMDQLYLR